jgi:large subunit ribosomal protein L19
MAENGLMQRFSNPKIRKDLPKFEVGNTVQVDYRIAEEDKERVQPFVGVIIAFHRGMNNLNATFTVRKEIREFAVERKFALHSPKIEKITVLKKGVVRRAKLYYMRKLSGKAARLNEKK